MDLSSLRIVSVLYPHWAGGKSIINALGLSAHSVLQHRYLAELQISGNLSPKNKFDLVIDKVKSSRYHWDDLGFGCIQLFGDRPEFAINQFKDYTKVNSLEFVLNDRMIEKAREKNLVLFRTIHDIRSWKKFEKLTDSFVIELINVKPVIEHRIGNKATHDFILAQEQELTDILAQTNRTPDFKFDCSSFFDAQEFEKNLKHLYNALSFDDFNAQWIEELRQTYLNVWEFNRPFMLAPAYNLQPSK